MLLMSQLFLYPLVYCTNRFCIRHTFPNIVMKKKMKVEPVVLVIILLFFAVGKNGVIGYSRETFYYVFHCSVKLIYKCITFTFQRIINPAYVF